MEPSWWLESKVPSMIAEIFWWFDHHSLTWFTWQDGPLFCGWDGQPLRVPPEEYEKRILQTRQSMQEVSLKRFGKCLELRERTKYRETWSVLITVFFFSVHICFESFRWKQDGIDFLIVVQPEECLRDWKKWCFSDLKDTVELVLQSYRSVRAIYNDQIPPVGHPKGWWTGRESPQMWP